MNRFLTTEDLNDFNYTRHRKKASKPYEETMLSLVDGKQEKLEVLLHGDPYDDYYVYQVDSIKLEEYPWIQYDFMIEYYRKEPGLGIYYGCRCVAEWGRDIFFAEDLADRHWDEVKREVIRVLNATFPGRDFSREFGIADNANDYTYWVFWLRLNPGEDIRDVAVRILSLIRNVYKWHLNLPFDLPSRISSDRSPNTSLRFTRWNYTNLIMRLTHFVRADENTISEILRKFIRLCEEREWVTIDPILECGYRFNAFMGYTQSQGCALMMVAFMRYVNEKVGKSKNSCISFPWDACASVFLNSEGEAWTPDALKTKITKLLKKKYDETYALIDKFASEIGILLEQH